MTQGVQRLSERLRGPGRALVCGIVNVTPDSFSDGGRHNEPSAAVSHALRLVDEGADILDIGGESTRPGSHRPSIQEEIDRVIPVVVGLVSRTDRSVSVDTSRPEVMEAAIAAGAVMINDVRGLRVPGALDVVAAAGVVVCVAHMQGEPDTMQVAPTYADVVGEASAHLAERVRACVRAGVPADVMIIDPGFGFGKSLEHNLQLFAGLPRLCELGPVMVGVSRKSMLGSITGRGVEGRVPASVAAALLAVQAGARLVRVHDVAATHDALAVLYATSLRGTTDHDHDLAAVAGASRL